MALADPAPPQPASDLPRALRPSPAAVPLFPLSWRYDDDRWDLWLMRADGALEHRLWRDCSAPMEGTVRGGQLVQQCARWPWLSGVVWIAGGAALVFLGARSEDELVRSAALFGGGVLGGYGASELW